jgi:hypothetical protein
MLNHSHWAVFKTTQEVWAAWGNIGFFFHAAHFIFFGTLEFLRNVFQDAWKNLSSWRNFIMPDEFRADYVSWFFFHFCSKTWELNKSRCLERIRRNLFEQAVEKFQAISEISPCPRYHKGWKFFNFDKKIGDSGKILMLEHFGHLGNFYAADSFGPLTKVEESLNLYPNISGTLEKS